MATKKKLLQAAAGNAAGAALNVESVFSTYLYDGNGSTQTITSGIDLSGEGGLTWIKSRTNTGFHFLFDTERGALDALSSELTNGEITRSNSLTSFNSNGFSLGSFAASNGSGQDYASWTFRKAEKFFDVVTYTGDGTGTQNISHNLGAVPGCIIVKRTDTTEDWWVYHRGISTPNDQVKLNTTDAAGIGSFRFGVNGSSLDINSSTFTVGGGSFGALDLNQNNGTYVAYLFAHNDGDGEFGPDGNADIIKCGSYTGNGTDQFIDLGFEPQWVMIKDASTGGTYHDWCIFDSMRKLDVSGSGNAPLMANLSDAEGGAYASSSYNLVQPTPTGMIVEGTSGPLAVGTNGDTYIYIAIRRPTAVPESAIEVFAIDEGDGVGAVSAYTSGFPVDFAIDRTATASSPNYVATRLLQGTRLQTDGTNAEASESAYYFDYMEGWRKFARAAGNYSWMWKRAPNYMDVVAYTGNGAAGRTVSHNLGVAPEMMWVKKRSGVEGWAVYHKLNGGTHFARLESTAAYVANANLWDNTNTTASVFTVDQDTEVNQSGQTYIAYLFASLDNISMVGSYTGTGGTAQTIDCGFSSGARMVIIKCSSHSGQWYIFDVNRGITATVNDGVLMLNNTTAQSPESSAFGSAIDAIQPDNSGFKVQYSDLNESGRTFIFYAIA